MPAIRIDFTAMREAGFKVTDDHRGVLIEPPKNTRYLEETMEHLRLIGLDEMHASIAMNHIALVAAKQMVHDCTSMHRGSDSENFRHIQRQQVTAASIKADEIDAGSTGPNAPARGSNGNRYKAPA